ncbi:MAG: hypothetical protein DIU63_07465 [Proteobacteria bacterium]|jgi:uncharacterized membrane-anchored protein|nr:MAG: hypothetical protein DIU63_07465 [Pseudomonadota bacterium]
MKSRRKISLPIVVAAAAQTVVLGWMIAERVTLLAHGREVVLPVVPVDPRSLFRGDYVNLTYEVTRLPGHLIEGKLDKGQKIYVTLKKEEDGNYQPVAATRTYPNVTASDHVVLLGRVQYDARNNSGSGNVFVRYGIESYFVPEGKGPELEKLARDQKLAVVLAVDGKGHAAIKGLVMNGELVYEEPLIW